MGKWELGIILESIYIHSSNSRAWIRAVSFSASSSLRAGAAYDGAIQLHNFVTFSDLGLNNALKLLLHRLLTANPTSFVLIYRSPGLVE